jgi:hypothetical protein
LPPSRSPAKVCEFENSPMTKHQAEQVADSLRAADWPVVYVEIRSM